MFFFLINFLFQKLSNLGRRHMDIIMAKTSLIIVHNVSVSNWKFVSPRNAFRFFLSLKLSLFNDHSSIEFLLDWLIDWLMEKNEKKEKETIIIIDYLWILNNKKKTLFVWMQMCVVCLFPSKLPLQHFNHHHHHSEWMNK